MRKIFLLLLFILVTSSVSAEIEYPNPTDKYINDYANLINKSDKQEIRNLLTKLNSDTGIEVTVVTITSLSDYGVKDFPLRYYAMELFERWGVGDNTKNNGILIFLSKNDREVWIEMGAGYARRHDVELQKVVDVKMLPDFKDGNLSSGLREGVEGVISIVNPKSLIAQKNNNAIQSDNNAISTEGEKKKSVLFRLFSFSRLLVLGIVFLPIFLLLLLVTNFRKLYGGNGSGSSGYFDRDKSARGGDDKSSSGGGGKW